ncbi:MAG: OmpA family protein [Crocinitomicaceae bacterium]
MAIQKSILFLVLFCGIQTLSFSQFSTKNKKAIKLYKKAVDAPALQLDPRTQGPDFASAFGYLDQALKKDPMFWEASLLMADYCRFTGQFSHAIQRYEQTLSINPQHSQNGQTYYWLANLYFKGGDYNNTLKYSKAFINHTNANPKYTNEAYFLRECALFSLDAIKNPIPFKPENLGSGVNTGMPEYFPSLTVDGKKLMYTRELPVGSTGRQEDFFYSNLKDGIWGTSIPMPKNVNTLRNEGAPTLSADGKSLIFVMCSDDDGDYGDGRRGKGSCDLFFTQRVGNQWTDPVNLSDSINTHHWESQPSLSADGKTLYFIRGLRGKDYDTKNTDIYVSQRKPNGKWTVAKRLSDVVNTPKSEESVHIHPDGRTLYFASNGHPGLGGSDLFVTYLGADGSWSKPKNLGYPINTKFDENSLLVSADGELAFFASDREGGYGDLDIYRFIMPEHIKPNRTLYFKGIVKDAITGNPLGAHFDLADKETGKVVIVSDSDPINGEFTGPLPINRWYVINVTRPGYIPKSLSFDLSYKEGQVSKEIEILLNPISNPSGENTLENIFFDFNSSVLKRESEIELRNLAKWLRENPSVRIELGGHTDTRGKAEDNLTLSTARAKAVYDYLIEKEKIEANRLTFKGYGETKPKVSDKEIEAMMGDNEKEAAHQKNRRTVYTLLP